MSLCVGGIVLFTTSFSFFLFPESTHVLDHPKSNNTSPVEEDAADDEEVCDLTENEGVPVSEEKVVCEIPVDPSKDVHPVSETVSAVIEEDAPKKSYASIVSYCISLSLSD